MRDGRRGHRVADGGRHAVEHHHVAGHGPLQLRRSAHSTHSMPGSSRALRARCASRLHPAGSGGRSRSKKQAAIGSSGAHGGRGGQALKPYLHVLHADALGHPDDLARLRPARACAAAGAPPFRICLLRRPAPSQRPPEASLKRLMATPHAELMRGEERKAPGRALSKQPQRPSRGAENAPFPRLTSLEGGEEEEAASWPAPSVRSTDKARLPVCSPR